MMSRSAFLVLLFLSCSFFCFSQTATPKTFALIIGISSYQDSAFRVLEFADKDARLFAGYLQSKAGGSVPDSQIKILLNEKATIAAVYNALDWLKQQVAEGDLVYFYFSGHGDVETNQFSPKAYLLTYNTPPTNYPNNAISIEQLNKDANFLTLQKKAKVVLITDACHSGKLAGDFFKGKQLAAGQLQLVLNNEVRLAACAVNEEAAEGEFWGGGRGVFSYYLLMGMYGFADELKDGTIQLKELQQFLDSSFKADEFLKQQKHKQKPVTDGNPNTAIAVVNKEAFITYNASLPPKENSKPLPQPIDYFFDAIYSLPLESTLNIKLYDRATAATLPLLVLNDCIVYQDSLAADAKTVLEYNPTIQKEDPEMYNEKMQVLNCLDSFKLLQTQLQQNKINSNRFIERFAELVQNRAQEMINAYINGDEAELEKRQYYYSGKRQYSDFLKLLRLVLKLMPDNYELSNVLQINEQYLSGVIARLQMATSVKTDSLLKASFVFQQQALQLQPYAAYIHNELANLYVHKKMFDSAQYHFNMASALSPAWAIPWNNRVRMNLMLKNNAKAKEALHKADSLQPDFSFVLMNAGLLMEQEQNLLEAESFYLRAIEKNNVHYLSYERLGALYLQMGKYRTANEYLHKAAERKNAFAINDAYFQFGVELGGNPFGKNKNLPDSCALSVFTLVNNKNPYVQLAAVLDQCMLSIFTQDTIFYGFLKEDSVLLAIQNIISKNPGLPLAHHYAGKILFKQGHYAEAEVYLKTARENFLAENELRKKFISGLYTHNEASKDSCIYNLLLSFIYDPFEDDYMLAAVYENQKQYKEAIPFYQNIIIAENKKQEEQAAFTNYEFYLIKYFEDAHKEDIINDPYNEIMQRFEAPLPMGGAVKLARLYEKMGGYELAEKTLLTQVMQNRAAGDLRRKVINENRPGTHSIIGVRINFYWLAINRSHEGETYNFYNRMMALFPRNYYWKEKAGMFLYERLKLTYKQMPAAQYKFFTEDMKKYTYPFLGGVEDAYPTSSVLRLPGTNEKLVIPLPVYNPVQQSLDFLMQSLTLNGDTEPSAQMNIILAEINSWLGNYEEAEQWYRKAIQLKPSDSLLRNQLWEILVLNNKFTAAKQQLDTLLLQKKIKPEQLLQLAEYHLQSNNYTRAAATLKLYKPADTSGQTEALKLTAIALMQQRKYAEALAPLQKISVLNKTNTVSEMIQQDPAVTDAQLFSYYTIAKAYAFMKQDAKAMYYLEKAMNAGFYYQYVLEQDKAWQLLRTGTKWKMLMKEYSQLLKDYTSQMNEVSGGLFQNPIAYRIPDQAQQE